jgi:hypothetical protein
MTTGAPQSTYRQLVLGRKQLPESHNCLKRAALLDARTTSATTLWGLSTKETRAFSIAYKRIEPSLCRSQITQEAKRDAYATPPR